VDTDISHDIARQLAEAEQKMTQAAAALLDCQLDLAIARHELKAVKRRLAAAAESLGPEEMRPAQAELAHAFIEISHVAALLMEGVTKLIAITEDVRPTDPQRHPS
jgi:hypothetical protein